MAYVRMPFVREGSSVLVANNLIFGWSYSAVYGEDTTGEGIVLDIINNDFVPGSVGDRYVYLQDMGEKSSVYFSGNALNHKIIGNQLSLVTEYNTDTQSILSPNQINKTALTPISADFVYKYCVANTGAQFRDPTDVRILGRIKNGDAALINSQQDVGGYLLVDENTSTLDIPDGPHKVLNGYTKIELWIESKIVGKGYRKFLGSGFY